MVGSETAEDIATRMNIPESEVPDGEAAAAVVHGSKLKVLDAPFSCPPMYYLFDILGVFKLATVLLHRKSH